MDGVTVTPLTTLDRTAWIAQGRLGSEFPGTSQYINVLTLTFVTSLSSPPRWTVAHIWTDTPAAIHTHGLTHTWTEGDQADRSVSLLTDHRIQNFCTLNRTEGEVKETVEEEGRDR